MGTMIAIFGIFSSAAYTAEGKRWPKVVIYFVGSRGKSSPVFFERASRGGIITAKQMHPEVCKAVGKEVSLDYVYRMLYRHSWRKVCKSSSAYQAKM